MLSAAAATSGASSETANSTAGVSSSFAAVPSYQHGGNVWGILNGHGHGWGCFFIHGKGSARRERLGHPERRERRRRV